MRCPPLVCLLFRAHLVDDNLQQLLTINGARHRQAHRLVGREPFAAADLDHSTTFETTFELLLSAPEFV